MDKIDIEIKQRMEEYVGYFGKSLSALERICGLGTGSLARISSRTTENVLRKLRNNCDINTDWLMRGGGEMTVKGWQPSGQGCGNTQVGINSYNGDKMAEAFLTEMKEQRDAYAEQLRSKDEQIKWLQGMLDRLAPE